MSNREFRIKYNKALREGDTGKATEVYKKYSESSTEDSEEDSGSEDLTEDAMSEQEKFEEINGVGEELAEELIQEYGTYPGFVEEADKESLVDISGVGEARAESLLEKVKE